MKNKYIFKYDQLNMAWYCWEIRKSYIDLVEWIEEFHPTAIFNY